MFRYLECVNTTAPDNGSVLGNVRGIGKKIRYQCNPGYRTKYKDNTVAECLDTGEWSRSIECEKGRTVLFFFSVLFTFSLNIDGCYFDISINIETA